MPEIKIKHVVSFSSEDKVHKAENLLKEETYRKWKCATPGEKNATIVLQFEKATKIHSIDVGNEGSAFVEVLVGRSSDSVSDYQVLLVASSFMSPIESRNGTQMNRVRFFGPEKLSQNSKDEKWDCVHIVCTQPFNKNTQYGLTFVKFHSPPEKIEEQPNTGKPVTKLGAFSLKYDDDSDDSVPSGSLFAKESAKASESASGPSFTQASPSYATVILNSSSNASKSPSQENSLKRKAADKNDISQEPPAKKAVLNKEHIIYKDVLEGSPETKKISNAIRNVKKDASSPKVEEKKKVPAIPSSSSKQVTNNNLPGRQLRKKVPLNKIMDRVVFVLSGFVNPLRTELREKALDMGAKYKADWDSTCTHLVCAFYNTPKYREVKKVNGRIVTKDWILDSYRKKEPLLWRKYELSNDDSPDENDDSDKDPSYSTKAAAEDDDDDEEEEEVEEIDENEETDKSVDEESDEDGKRKKKRKMKHQRKKVANTPKKKTSNISDGEEESVPKKKATDTDLSKKVANTPKKTTSNISDSEEESRTSKKKMDSGIFNKLGKLQHDVSSNSQSPTPQKVEEESETEDEEALQDYVADTDVEDDDSGGDTEDEIRKVEQRAQKKKKTMNGVNKAEEYSKKPDVSDLPLPDLPNFFKGRRFFLFGDFSPSKLHALQRYITAYNGILEDYMSDKVKYVITERKWDSNFENALSENEDLIFVKPTWIYKCHENEKLMPYQPYIIIPDS